MRSPIQGLSGTVRNNVNYKTLAVVSTCKLTPATTTGSTAAYWVYGIRDMVTSNRATVTVYVTV